MREKKTRQPDPKTAADLLTNQSSVLHVCRRKVQEWLLDGTIPKSLPEAQDAAVVLALVPTLAGALLRVAVRLRVEKGKGRWATGYIVSGPPSCADLISRLRRVLKEFLERLPEQARRVLECSPLPIKLVRKIKGDFPEGASPVGVCHTFDSIELAIHFVKLALDEAVMALLAHELAHWYRCLMGEDYSDEVATDLLANAWGFGILRFVEDAGAADGDTK